MNCPNCCDDGRWHPLIDKDNKYVGIYYSGLLKKYVLHVCYKEELKIPIQYCPMCGRELNKNA